MLLIFVEEADRLVAEGNLLQAIVSLGNALSCRGVTLKDRADILRIIEGMSNAFEKGE